MIYVDEMLIIHCYRCCLQCRACCVIYLSVEKYVLQFK